MTLDEYLEQQGYYYRPSQGSGEDASRGGWARDIGGGDDAYVQFLEGDNEQDVLRGYQYALQQLQPQTPQPPQPTPQPTPQAPQPQTPIAPRPNSLEEFMQQKALERGYEKTPLRKVYNTAEGSEEVDPSRNEDYLTTINPAWAKRVMDVGDGYSNSVLMNIEQQLKNEYYADPNNFISTRETPVGQGVNTFNEGNANQKQVIDQINSGQLRIVPVSYEVTANTDSGPELRTGYELKDARTGQTVQQQVIPIDPSKGIYSIGADDPNSSGYFTNFVSTDPKGFVNPIVSEQQSQYNSHANNSLNFIKDSIKGLITMGGLGATALGAGAALGSATGLGTVGGNIALNTGLGALKQGIDGQFNPLGLATSAALSYGLGGAGGGENINLPSETPYVDLPDGESLLTPNVVTPDVSTLTDDASRLAQMLKEFENPTELTGPTIDTAGRATVTLEDGVIDSQAPIMPSNLQDTAYLDPGLIDVAPENVTIGTPDATPYFDASPTFPTLDVSPEYDPNAYLPITQTGTNIPTIGGNDLGGFDNIPSNVGTNLGGGIPTDLGGFDVPFDTIGMDIGFKNPDLSAGELTVTGERPYVPFEENFPLPYEPFEENFPLQTETTETTTETTPVTKPKLLSNILKSTPSALPKAIATQQQSNLANILRGSQMPQTALPPIYKQANPFNFGQQNQPVQDVSALAKLLRTA